VVPGRVRRRESSKTSNVAGKFKLSPPARPALAPRPEAEPDSWPATSRTLADDEAAGPGVPAGLVVKWSAPGARCASSAARRRSR